MATREDLDAAAELFKVLSSTSRLHLLSLLSEGPDSVTGLTDRTGMSQPLVSQHLRTLRSAGLVDVERHGREAEYSLVDQHVTHIVVDAVAHTREGHSDRLSV
jgi:DNA-binding transcriptional ArsR family regulator